MARTPKIDLRDDYLRNYIINGNFDFWQRGTSSNTVQTYLADRFQYFGSTWTVDYTRQTDVPAEVTDALYSMRIFRTFGPNTVLSTHQASVDYKIEGYDAASLLDKVVTLSFWVKADAAGTYGLSFVNGALNRSYVTTYNISTANTWEKKIITLNIDSTGTWDITSGIGLRIRWSFGDGSNFETTTTNQWQAGDFKTTTTARKPVEDANSYLQLAQVQLTQGSEALPFRRAGRTIGEELAMCLRYFEKPAPELPGIFAQTVTVDTNPTVLNGDFYGAYEYKVSKRATPAAEVYSFDQSLSRGSSVSTVFGASSGLASADRNNIRLLNVSGVSLNMTTGTGRSAADYFFTADAEL